MAEAKISLRLLLVLLVLFEDASFSREVSAVLASVVSPDCRSALSVFSNDSTLDALDVELDAELTEEVLLVLDVSSGGGGP